ncbi:MAG: hypothetical protein WC098_04800 [Bacteroidales bacterium]|jgi:hypothetical protein
MKKIVAILLIGMVGLLTTGCEWFVSGGEDNNNAANYADWNLLIMQYPILKAFPDFMGSVTFLEQQKQLPLYEIIIISTQDQYVDNYIKVLKNNGFSTSPSGHNFKVQLKSSKRLGAYWRFVGFNPSDYPGYTDITFSSTQ